MQGFMKFDYYSKDYSIKQYATSELGKVYDNNVWTKSCFMFQLFIYFYPYYL